MNFHKMVLYVHGGELQNILFSAFETCNSGNIISRTEMPVRNEIIFDIVITRWNP